MATESDGTVCYDVTFSNNGATNYLDRWGLRSLEFTNTFTGEVFKELKVPYGPAEVTVQELCFLDDGVCTCYSAEVPGNRKSDYITWTVGTIATGTIASGNGRNPSKFCFDCGGFGGLLASSYVIIVIGLIYLSFAVWVCNQKFNARKKDAHVKQLKGVEMQRV